MILRKEIMGTSYQLRKIGLPASVEKVRNFYRITSDTTLIGRGQQVDVFLDSNIRKGLISRAHAQIIQKEVNGKVLYEIFDTSLNGTYVNDVRVKNSVTLKEGDIVAFGHLRGSLIEPGTLAPQKETEFLFKFEKCLHPEVKEEMVDLTEKELNNNSSVFMSPKSPVGENGEPLPGLNNVSITSIAIESAPSVKKRKLSKTYIDDEEDLKEVVKIVTSKIKSNGNISDDELIVLDIDTKLNEFGSGQVLPSKHDKLVLPNEPNKLIHPRNKVLPPIPYNGDIKMNTTLDVSHEGKNGTVKISNAKHKRLLIEKVNGTTESEESEYEIESESESEYLEDTDSDYSEKSEEIPDDSSDNEYIPKGRSGGKKGKQKPIVPPPVLVNCEAPTQKVNFKTESQNDNKRRKKRSNSFVHDKCDALDCNRPSGTLKTVTWVQCDDCDAWYHVSCSGLTLADVKKRNTIFRCGCS